MVFIVQTEASQIGRHHDKLKERVSIIIFQPLHVDTTRNRTSEPNVTLMKTAKLSIKI